MASEAQGVIWDLRDYNHSKHNGVSPAKRPAIVPLKWKPNPSVGSVENAERLKKFCAITDFENMQHMQTGYPDYATPPHAWLIESNSPNLYKQVQEMQRWTTAEQAKGVVVAYAGPPFAPMISDTVTDPLKAQTHAKFANMERGRSATMWMTSQVQEGHDVDP